jgi:hypothetical protein
LACSVTAQTTRPLPDHCRIRFKMDDRISQTCNSGSKPTNNGSTITLIGKRIADGFFWERKAISAASSADKLWAKRGTTVQPAGSIFQSCAGNWVYFKASGFNHFSRVDSSNELTNIYIRIKAFGNEQNPDSLRVEFAQNTNVRPEKLYNSAHKDMICQGFDCIWPAPDNFAPYMPYCPEPTETILFPLKSNNATIQSAAVFKQAQFEAEDDCNIADIRTYPYKLLNVTNGQIVNYRTIAYDSSGNQGICRFKAKFLLPSNDTCFPKFKMEYRKTPTCNGVSTFAPSSYSITLLGKRVSDGIKIHKNGAILTGVIFEIFGKNGLTTPPTGSHFIACAGNWTYFTMNGWSIGSRNSFREPLINKHIRIKCFGNESNPDSLQVEFAENQSPIEGHRFFNTSWKEVYCNKCQAADNTPPVIRNCPTQLVRYPVPYPSGVYGNDIAEFTRIQITDPCELSNQSVYPHYVLEPKKGQLIDYQAIAYDEMGNKSVCNFKVQLIAAPCSVYQGPLLDGLYDANRVVTAAAGQTCKVVTWKEPTVFQNSSFNPVKITSNYRSGHCFPIGVTHVLYTAKDSCGKIDTAGFYVTVKLAPKTKVHTIENQMITLDIKSLSPNPTNGALLMTLESLVEKEVIFDFYNAVGSKVHSQTHKVQNGENELFFDVTKLPTGVYFIQTSELGDLKTATQFVKY